MINSHRLLSLALVAAIAGAIATDSSATNGHHGNGGSSHHSNNNNHGDDDDDDGGGNNHHGDDDDDDGGNCGGGGDDDDDDGGSNPCLDVVPPVIFCPPTAKIVCDSPTTPSALGSATATDDTDLTPTITYKDSVNRDFCGATRFDSLITRTWKAKDDCGNVTTCVQKIDVLKHVTFMDVLPGTCPNVVPAGPLPLKITLAGTDAVRANKIVLSSLELWVEDCTSGSVRPQLACYGDSISPYAPSGPNACVVTGPDGKNDITLYFSRYRLDQEFGLNTLPAGTTLRLVLSGRMCNGCDFLAIDYLTVP